MRRVIARESEFASAVSDELDRSPWETFTEEIEPLMASCRWHRRRGLALLRPRRLPGRAWWQFGQRHWKHRVPRGQVAIIATWNYPVQLLGIQLVQAITAGNRVVVKPSEYAPRTQGLLLECAKAAADDAHFPPEWITSVEATREAGRRLLEDERFDFVVFTGSTEVGRLVAARCAHLLTPSALELSGRDSAIVLADADLALAARSIWHALTMNGGQTCMAPRRVLVEEGAYRAFLSALAPLAAGARPRRLISAESAQRCHALVQEAIGQGARSVTGWVACPEGPEGRSLRPMAIVDCPTEGGLFEGRHFGPVMAVTPVASVDEALALDARGTQKLATSLFTGSPTVWRRSRRIADMKVGIITINDAVIPTGHPAASIGGVGESGWSLTRGEGGLQELTREVILSTSARRVRVPLEPPGASGERFLRKVARWLAGT
ncbi:MAG: aldehyde dehydrogenase family protein [Phycisphaeraceae bacterium]|nr:aldehyde dehydrogenase family protein [Phycisphaeraceae bacterium]